MILDRLDNWRRYAAMNEGFARAFEFLARSDLAELKEGRHEIDGDRVFAVVVRADGKGRSGARLEAHRKYIDIQYCLAGDEEIGWRAAGNCAAGGEGFDADADLIFYDDAPQAFLPTPGGTFAIFFPADAHAPLAGTGPLHKVVVKVAATDHEQDPRKLDKALASTQADDDVQWTDIQAFELEGRGWTDTAATYDRLPARAESMVRRAVWNLGRNSAGLAVRFVTDATTISARWTLRFEPIAMPHMPATGVSGLDLYGKDADRWIPVGLGKPERFPTNRLVLAKRLTPALRQYLLYLPLYNGVDAVAIGVPPGAKLAAAPPRVVGASRAICFYGTSIVQGGCASRCGMAYPAILGRWLDRETINLGFSGNGKMESELADLLGELDVAVYVLDSLGNLTLDEASERVEPFIRKLRRARPGTPIVLVEEMSYTDSTILPPAARPEKMNAILRDAYHKLQAEGEANLHYVPAAGMLGDDGEATVDGCHPTDLGFLRMARALAPVLGDLVGG